MAYTSLWSLSVVRDMGEVEQRERFGYALTKAMDLRRVSARKLAADIGVDQRRIAALRQGKMLPTIYESPRLAAALGVDERLFREPPEIPKPPPYPLEDYLLETIALAPAVEQAAAEGIRRLRTPSRAAPGPHPRQPARRARAS